MPRHSSGSRGWTETFAGSRGDVDGDGPDQPIDQRHLARYTVGDVVLETEILGLFSTQSSELFAQMTSARTAPEWKFATHSLKGSARAVGAWSVAELAAEAEFCAPLTVSANDLVARISQELERTYAFVAEAYPAAQRQSA